MIHQEDRFIIDYEVFLLDSDCDEMWKFILIQEEKCRFAVGEKHGSMHLIYGHANYSVV
jgi:hypothetical protein